MSTVMKEIACNMFTKVGKYILILRGRDKLVFVCAWMYGGQVDLEMSID